MSTPRPKTLLFDTSQAEAIGSIRRAIVHYDTYFDEDEGETTLAIIMDKILADLPEHLADAVRLVYLEGHSYRTCAKILGIDHKTVKARANKGVEAMRERLVDSVWMADMLRGYIPEDEMATPNVRGAAVADILGTLGGQRGEQE